MKMLNAWTFEAEDPKIAIAEILKQLDLQNNLLTHSSGFITCSYDYVETGMVKAISEALPFDIVGCTTLTNAVDGETGTMLLCLSVLTADDCRFSCAHTLPLHNNLHTVISEEFARATAELGDTPKLILAFSPMIDAIGGELILDALDKAANGIPIYGTLACDFDTARYSNSYTFYNGECSRDRMAFIVISGNVHPRFVVTSTSEQNLFKQRALITASEGTVLKSVNGMTASEYFTSIGLVQGNGVEGMSSVPFIVDYNDGTQPVARAIYSLNEDGSALCGGVMPKGGTLSLGRMDVEDILLTAKRSITTLLAAEELNGIIMFPCLGRNMVLGVEPLAEVNAVAALMKNSLPWHLAYSGGEVCPVYAGNETVNRFHNFTFIACAI